MKDYYYLFVLPNRFKAAGLIVAAAAAIVALVSNLNPPMIRTLLSVFILGLLLFVLAKEKHEVVRARYVSMMHATVVAIFQGPDRTSAYAWDEGSLRLGFP